MKKSICFEIKGSYAHYKKPYSPMSPVTYPIPTPASLSGLIGAICGYSKDHYQAKVGSDSAKFAIIIKNPIHIHRAAINLINTKDGHFIPHGDNYRMQIPYEFVKDAHFRIYTADLSKDAHFALLTQLEKGTTVYTPSLGLANCIADVSFVGEFDAEPLGDKQCEHCHSVISYSAGVKICYEQGKRYQRIRVPANMDDSRVVRKYQEVMLVEDAGTMNVEGVGLYHVNEQNVAFL